MSDKKRTMMEAVEEACARIAYICARTDGTFFPPAMREVYDILHEARRDNMTPRDKTSMRSLLCEFRELGSEMRYSHDARTHLLCHEPTEPSYRGKFVYEIIQEFAEDAWRLYNRDCNALIADRDNWQRQALGENRVVDVLLADLVAALKIIDADIGMKNSILSQAQPSEALDDLRKSIADGEALLTKYRKLAEELANKKGTAKK